MCVSQHSQRAHPKRLRDRSRIHFSDATTSPERSNVGSCPLRFNTFLDGYADPRKNSMDTHDFV